MKIKRGKSQEEEADFLCRKFYKDHKRFIYGQIKKQVKVKLKKLNELMNKIKEKNSEKA